MSIFGTELLSVSELNALLSFSIKLLLAMACATVIGLEREAKHRPAGLRTHIIVCIASTLIMAVGVLLKEKYAVSSPNLDAARMGAQIVSGIGFLGAGTIIKGKDNVFGLTTAATLWSVAGIGITVGSGFYIEAVMATVCIFLVLKLINFFENSYRRTNSKHIVSLYIDGPLENVKRLSTVLEYSDIIVDYLHIKGFNRNEGEELITVELGIKVKKHRNEPLFDPIIFFENYDFVRTVYEVNYPELSGDGGR